MAAALVAAVIAFVSGQALTTPAAAQTVRQLIEPPDVQEKVDEALGVVELPDPASVHLPAPLTVRPPLTGQPYEQQPAAAQDNFLTGGRR